LNLLHNYFQNVESIADVRLLSVKHELIRV